jgi:putative flippase GtrA
MTQMKVIIQQFLSFAGVGCLSAVGHYGLLITLVQLTAVHAVVASAAGALLGGVINYALNYYFTFASSKPHRDSGGKFVLVAATGLGLNTLLMWIGVELLGNHYLVVQLITTGVVLIWSFLGNRCWTFNDPVRTKPRTI